MEHSGIVLWHKLEIHVNLDDCLNPNLAQPVFAGVVALRLVGRGGVDNRGQQLQKT